MFWLILIAIIILIVLASKGVFRKEAECKHCGKLLKGTEQYIVGLTEEAFPLCEDCFKLIDLRVKKCGISEWNYSDYVDYLKWEEESKEERSKFNPNYEYGSYPKLRIDTERGLFSLSTTGWNDLVFRFEDVADYDINFKPKEVKDGVFSTKVSGSEYISIELNRPYLKISETLGYGEYSARKRGIVNKKYEYELSGKFLDIIRAFAFGMYIAHDMEEDEIEIDVQNINEIDRALALFMFDSMEEVTEETLKLQRNALIKAFHPDNNDNNDAYSQKINAAYELLSKMIK